MALPQNETAARSLRGDENLKTAEPFPRNGSKATQESDRAW